MSPLNLTLPELIARLDQDLAGGDPLAKISEAQLRAHTLNALGDQLVGHYVAKAKQHGASWTEIGEAIGVTKQAAQQRYVPHVFDRFTNYARHAVVLAQEAARTHRHDYIGTEHLLLGVLGEIDGLGAKLLIEHAGTAAAVRTAVTNRLGPAGDKAPRGHIPFTDLGKDALTQATEQAATLGHDFVGTEHLLLGLLAVPGGLAAEALTELGLDLATARTEVADRIAQVLAQKTS